MSSLTDFHTTRDAWIAEMRAKGTLDDSEITNHGEPTISASDQAVVTDDMGNVVYLWDLDLLTWASESEIAKAERFGRLDKHMEGAGNESQRRSYSLRGVLLEGLRSIAKQQPDDPRAPHLIALLEGDDA